MGGHGALTIFLKNPGAYKSVSAFAPICNPTQCPWGQKAFGGYLGDANKEAWQVAIIITSSYCAQWYLKLFDSSSTFACNYWYMYLQEYDACCLVKKYDGPQPDILVDQVMLLLLIPFLFVFIIPT